MERRDNYEKALREEDEALRASMGKRADGSLDGTADKKAPKKPTPIASRWARAKREADKKKKPR
jgi:hypothetical protein